MEGEEENQFKEVIFPILTIYVIFYLVILKISQLFSERGLTN